MSDTFDHEWAAWESRLAEWDVDDADPSIGELSYGGAKGNPDYYHSWQTISGIVRETEKAYLIDPFLPIN